MGGSTRGNVPRGMIHNMSPGGTTFDPRESSYTLGSNYSCEDAIIEGARRRLEQIIDAVRDHVDCVRFFRTISSAMAAHPGEYAIFVISYYMWRHAIPHLPHSASWTTPVYHHPWSQVGSQIPSFPDMIVLMQEDLQTQLAVAWDSQSRRAFLSSMALSYSTKRPCS